MIEENVHGMMFDTFLASDPIKPYHVDDSILPYAEIRKRKEKMDRNTIINRVLGFEDFEEKLFETKN